MRSETAIEAAMKRAGGDTTMPRLRGIITAALEKRKGNPERAVDDVEAQTRGKPDLIRAALRMCVEVIAAERSGKELPGEGQGCRADKGLPDPANARQPNGDEVGHGSCADGGHGLHAENGQPAPAPIREPSERFLVARNDKGRFANVTREPSAVELAAARKVRSIAANSIWERSIGGEVKLGTATKSDLRQLGRKSHIVGHSVNRMLTEFSWPDDDKTTLPQVATEDQVRAILESGARSLNALEFTHA